jgi:nitroreductase
MNTTLTPEQLITQLKWRYAVKQFDTTRKISSSDWATLEEAVRLSPSSAGLQPYTWVVVKDPEMRAKLRAASYGQPQITDASHLVVFTSRTNFSETHLDEYLKRVTEVRGVSFESLAPFRANMVGMIQGMDQPTRNAWCKNQLYISLGFLLASAAVLGIDACPMEGIDRVQYDSILGLTQTGLTAGMVATLGYRSPSDKYAEAAKVRFPKEKLFIEV